MQTLKKALTVFLSLLMALSMCAAAFAESADNTVNIMLDFCAGHEALATMLAESLNTEADGAVVPVTLTGEQGTVSEASSRINELLFTSGIMDVLGEPDALKIHNGEQYYGSGLKAMAAYADEDEYFAERNNQWETAINDGDTLFIHWKKPAQSVTVTIDAPVCGTEVEWANDRHEGSYAGNSPHTHPSPKITVDGDAVLFHNPYHGGVYADGVYVDNAEGNMATNSIDQDGYFQGTIKGGESYYVVFSLESSFGYYLADSTEILVNGAAPVHRSPFVASVTAVHVQPDADLNVITPATCTTPGVGSYVCQGCGETVETQIPATGHDWNAPTWTWNEDGSAASATFTCANGDHPETVEATVTPVAGAVKPATCTVDGADKRSASVTFNGTAYTDEKTIVLPSAGHDYGDPVWVWSGDFSLAVLTLSCKTCDAEAVRIAAISEVKTAPTATEDGAIVYTASVTVDGKAYTDTKTVVVPATGTPDEPQHDSTCKWCGETHTGVFGGIIEFFHSILYFFAHLFGKR